MENVQKPERAKLIDDPKARLEAVVSSFPSSYADRVQKRMRELTWFQETGMFDSEHFRNKKVLDWEAGDAAFAVALILLGAKSVTAIDSWTTLETVPSEVRSLPGFEFQNIEVSDYVNSNSGEKSSYDFVFSNTVTEHIADLAGAFDSLRSLLKIDGRYFNNHDNYYSPCGSHDHGFWFYGDNTRIVFQGVTCWKTEEKCSASEAHRTRICQELPWTWSEKNNNELTPSNCENCRYFKRSQEWAHIRAYRDFPETFDNKSFLSMRKGSSLNKITPFQLIQLLNEAGFEIIHLTRTTVKNEPTEDLLELGLSKLDLQTSMVSTLCRLKPHAGDNDGMVSFKSKVGTGTK